MARAVSVLAALALIGLLAFTAPAAAELKDSIVIKWTYLAQRVVRQLRLTNQLSAKLYGHVGVAQYLAYKQAKGNAAVNADLASAFAAHSVLARTNPNLAPSVLDTPLYEDVVASGVSVAVRDASAALGIKIGIDIATASATDAGLQVSYYRPGYPDSLAKDDVYVFTPEQIGAPRDFLLYPNYANGSTFIYPVSKIPALTAPYLKAPFKFGSADFEAENKVVLEQGGTYAPNRTPYDTDTARFWLGAVSGSGGQGSAGVTGMVQNISIALLPGTYTPEQQAAFFAKLGTAFYDAIVAVWYVKFKVPRWRPITAIQKYYNASWTPLLGTPQHPEYPSAHQGIFGGGWSVLVRELGGKTDYTFTVKSDWPNIADRTYTNLNDAAAEAGNSRIFAGAHWAQANNDAFAIGKAVGEYIYDNIDKLIYGKQAPLKW
ncbi:hypothetical protein CHLRE_13g585500v5 [Chlamydomonas reinhardtii]|uniref:Phosphatidic acid phosphatase type 2/haloperoxidase domain-containing protein n=1 Tax=Chlamydomonas reinhardtii TaxID=3055 RepID=A0A2K3D0Q8_CHLRE|nr:uncharacterized protein CHLRE_13g585500v5 [Chlamydomonas reinhardtii]PNW74107.1 hypothetical protein CHLRE_13g585500v5 [Chlamydomonas reinhardtii]